MMPSANPRFCQLCGNMVEKHGLRAYCFICAVEINPRGGVVFPPNEVRDGLPPQRYITQGLTPYTIFNLFMC